MVATVIDPLAGLQMVPPVKLVFAKLTTGFKNTFVPANDAVGQPAMEAVTMTLLAPKAKFVVEMVKDKLPVVELVTGPPTKVGVTKAL